MSSQQYRTPFPPNLLLVYQWIVVSLVAGAACGAVLSLLKTHIPFDLVVVVVLFGMAALPGLMTGLIGRWCRVPHPAFLVAGGVAAGAAAAYAFMAMQMTSFYDYAYLFWKPWEIWLVLPASPDELEVVDATTGQASAATSLDFYWLFGEWLVAILGSLVGGPFVAYLVSRHMPPLCDQCGRWMTKPDDELGIWAVDNAEAFRDRLMQGDFAALETLRPTTNDETETMVILTARHCTECGGPYVIDAKKFVLVQGENGLQEKKTILVHHLITPDDFVAEMIARERLKQESRLAHLKSTQAVAEAPQEDAPSLDR
ncbi:MAG: hypothetical protein AAF586_08270 [Planctomycetota bacterium]